nr:hypothetical protein [Tanacetum cinerariifolium]
MISEIGMDIDARLSMRHIDAEAWVAQGVERQPDAADGAKEVAEGAPDVDESAQAVPAPTQAPQPPPAAAQDRTMPQRHAWGGSEELRSLVDTSSHELLITSGCLKESLRGTIVVVREMERQPDAAAGAKEVAEGAPDVDESAQAVPAPAQAPQPPPAAAQGRTMPQRSITNQFRFATWMISCMTQLIDASGHTYQVFDSTLFGSSEMPYHARTKRRTDEANTSAPHQPDV